MRSDVLRAVGAIFRRLATENLRIWNRSAILLVVLIVQTGFCSAEAAEPLRALMVCGGCCHDYEAQKKILSEGISARANVTWTIVHEGTDRTHYASIYTNADWAKGFDAVLHNECFGQATNVAFVEGIVRAHTS